MVVDPGIHGGCVDDVTTVCELDKCGVFFILRSKEHLELIRMTGLASVRAGITTQANAEMSAGEDEVTWLRAGVTCAGLAAGQLTAAVRTLSLTWLLTRNTGLGTHKL